MAKYSIHQRKSMIDKDTKVVTVTKKKSLSETLFGEEENQKLKPGKYTVHERTSVLDKDTKIVTVTKEKTLSETLFGTEEEQRQKNLDYQRKNEKQKDDNKRYLQEQNQKMIHDYNELLNETNRMYQEQAYNNKVVGEDITEGISSQELKKQKDKFDYSKVSEDKKKDYLKFVANYFNAMNKGFSVDFVKLRKKKNIFKEQEEYDGPKYWEIKRDEHEFELNKGYRFEYTALVIDENGEFWNKYVGIGSQYNQVEKKIMFDKINGISDDLVAFVDISLERQKIDLSLDQYLSMNDSSCKKVLLDLENHWTDENYQLKEKSIKREKDKKLYDYYHKFVFLSRLVILPLVLLPILFVVLYLPLFLLIPYVIIISAVYGFIKESLTITQFVHMFSLIVTSILMLIRGYHKAFLSMLIMIGISVGIMYLMTFIESKISNKISKMDLYH